MTGLAVQQLRRQYAAIEVSLGRAPTASPDRLAGRRDAGGQPERPDLHTVPMPGHWDWNRRCSTRSTSISTCRTGLRQGRPHASIAMATAIISAFTRRPGAARRGHDRPAVTLRGRCCHRRLEVENHHRPPGGDQDRAAARDNAKDIPDCRAHSPGSGAAAGQPPGR